MRTYNMPNRTITESRYELWQCWKHSQSFDQADEWLQQFQEDDAGWDGGGLSYINGAIYPSFVYFKNTEDYLMFRLKWSELLKW